MKIIRRQSYQSNGYHKKEEKEETRVGLVLISVFVALVGYIWINSITNRVPLDTYIMDKVSGRQELKETFKQDIEALEKGGEEARKSHEQEIKTLQAEKDNLQKMLDMTVAGESLDKTKKDVIIKVISKHLKGVFVGKSRYIYSVSKGEKINPLLMASIIRLETGNGTSVLTKAPTHNPGGLNWFEGCKYPKGGKNDWYQKFPSLDRGIYVMAVTLKDYYIDDKRKTIPEIGEKYAPPTDKRNGIGGMDNTVWVKNVTDLYNIMAKEAGI